MNKSFEIDRETNRRLVRVREALGLRSDSEYLRMILLSRLRKDEKELGLIQKDIKEGVVRDG